MMPESWSICDKLPGTHFWGDLGWRVEVIGKGERVMRKKSGSRLLEILLSPTGSNCSINWATYIADEKNLLLLVETLSPNLVKIFYLLNFNLGNQIAWSQEGMHKSLDCGPYVHPKHSTLSS